MVLKMFNEDCFDEENHADFAGGLELSNDGVSQFHDPRRD